jgi:hypothetical protein
MQDSTLHGIVQDASLRHARERRIDDLLRADGYTAEGIYEICAQRWGMTVEQVQAAYGEYIRAGGAR